MVPTKSSPKGACHVARTMKNTQKNNHDDKNKPWVHSKPAAGCLEGGLSTCKVGILEPILLVRKLILEKGVNYHQPQWKFQRKRATLPIFTSITGSLFHISPIHIILGCFEFIFQCSLNQLIYIFISVN